MTEEDADRDPGPCPLSRRDFMRIGCTALAGSVAAGLMPSLAAAADGAAPAGGYPVLDVAALDAIAEGVPLSFTYPDERSPALLVRLPQSAAGGVGPNGSIVAYSSLCTHKGCAVSYRAERQMFICPCHWSSFDPARAGQMVIGQASARLPQITLRIKAGVVQAIGVEGLIYGRHTNIV